MRKRGPGKENDFVTYRIVDSDAKCKSFYEIYNRNGEQRLRGKDDKIMTKRKKTGAFLHGGGCGAGAEAPPVNPKRTKQTWADPILK